MPTAYTPEGYPIPDDQLQQAVASGKIAFKSADPVHFINGEGQHVSVPGSEAFKALGQGYKLLTEQQAAEHKAVKEMGESGAHSAAAVGLGAARALTGGLSDAAIAEMGGQEYLQHSEAAAPALNTLGEVAGYALPVGAALGVGGKAVGLATAPLRAVSAGARAVGEVGAEALGGAGIKAVAPALAGAVEGAEYGIQQGVSNNAIHDEPMTVGNILLNSAVGMGVGGVLGHVLPASSAVKEARLAAANPNYVSIAEREAATAAKGPLRSPPWRAIPSPSAAGYTNPLYENFAATEKKATDAAFKRAALLGTAEHVGDEAKRNDTQDQAVASDLIGKKPSITEAVKSGFMEDPIAWTKGKLNDFAVAQNLRGVAESDIAKMSDVEKGQIAATVRDTLDGDISKAGLYAKAARAEAETALKIATETGHVPDTNGLFVRAENDILSPLRNGAAEDQRVGKWLDREYVQDLRNKAETTIKEDQIKAAIKEKQSQLVSQRMNEIADSGLKGDVATKAMMDSLPEITKQAENEIREQINSVPKMGYEDLLEVRNRIGARLSNKPADELINTISGKKELAARKLYDALGSEIQEQLSRTNPELAKQFANAAEVQARLEKIANLKKSSKENSLMKDIFGGAIGGALLGHSPIGAAIGAAKHALLTSSFAKRLAADAARAISSDASTMSLPNVLKMAGESAAKSASIIDGIIKGETFNLSKLNIKAAALAIPIAVGKQTASFAEFRAHIAQQTSLGQEDKLAALAHSPNLQAELATTQTKALQLAKDTLPNTKINNPMLGDAQPPPSLSEARDYSNMISLMNNPSKIFGKIQNGTVTRKDIDTMNTVLPAVMQQITAQATKATQASIQHGQALRYQERLRMGIVTGTPWDPSDTPQNTQTIQNIWGSISAPKPPSAGRGRRGSGRVPGGTTMSDRARTESEKILT
jgi:hypothetical protein